MTIRHLGLAVFKDHFGGGYGSTFTADANVAIVR